ncbi:MAG: hypothetical protein K0Q73_8116 [Paenibacillus sp.]|nr:hypothetical protein [Paenibacillus sp.]
MIDVRSVERVTIDSFPIDCIVTSDWNSDQEPTDYYRFLMSTIADEYSGQIITYVLKFAP